MIKHRTEWDLNEYILYENKLGLKFILEITLLFLKKQNIFMKHERSSLIKGTKYENRNKFL